MRSTAPEARPRAGRRPDGTIEMSCALTLAVLVGHVVGDYAPPATFLYVLTALVAVAVALAALGIWAPRAGTPRASEAWPVNQARWRGVAWARAQAMTDERSERVSAAKKRDDRAIAVCGIVAAHAVAGAVVSGWWPLYIAASGAWLLLVFYIVGTAEIEDAGDPEREDGEP